MKRLVIKYGKFTLKIPVGLLRILFFTVAMSTQCIRCLALYLLRVLLKLWF